MDSAAQHRGHDVVNSRTDPAGIVPREIILFAAVDEPVELVSAARPELIGLNLDVTDSIHTPLLDESALHARDGRRFGLTPAKVQQHRVSQLLVAK